MDASPAARCGPYTLLRKLANGGGCEIFVAALETPFGFHKPLVLKRLYPHLAADDRTKSRFIQEGQRACALSHPNLVDVLELGEADGTYYLVMEYVDGFDLSTAGRLLGGDGPTPFYEAAFLIARAAEAVGYLHTLRDETGAPAGILHRNLTPSNVLVSRTGVVKVIDLGLAKATDSKTRSKTLMGELSYLSPEQLDGQLLDERADVFSLGVLLYELLAGRPPFAADAEHDLLHAIRHSPHPPLSVQRPGVPEPLAAAVDRSLSKQRTARQQDARAFARELEELSAAAPAPITAGTLAQLLAGDGFASTIPASSVAQLLEEASERTRDLRRQAGRQHHADPSPAPAAPAPLAVPPARPSSPASIRQQRAAAREEVRSTSPSGSSVTRQRVPFPGRGPAPAGNQADPPGSSAQHPAVGPARADVEAGAAPAPTLGAARSQAGTGEVEAGAAPTLGAPRSQAGTGVEAGAAPAPTLGAALGQAGTVDSDRHAAPAGRSRRGGGSAQWLGWPLLAVLLLLLGRAMWSARHSEEPAEEPAPQRTLMNGGRASGGSGGKGSGGTGAPVSRGDAEDDRKRSEDEARARRKTLKQLREEGDGAALEFDVASTAEQP